MQRLISVLRRPLGIFAVVSERTRPFDPALDPGQPFEDPYRERVVPLSTLPEQLCPWKDKDVKAWRALSAVPNLSRRAGVAIVRSIIGSATDPDVAVGALEPLSEVFASARGPVDVRPYLCTAHHEQQLLAALGDTLIQVSSETEFPDWHWTRRHELAVLPPAFRHSFLWGLHLSPWRRVELTLAVYEALELDADPVLRHGLARLLSFCDRPIGLAWCRVLADLDRAERARACEMILESGAYVREPTDEARRALESIASHA